MPVETPDTGLGEPSAAVEEEENKESRPEYCLVDALLELNKSEGFKLNVPFKIMSRLKLEFYGQDNTPISI